MHYSRMRNARLSGRLGGGVLGSVSRGVSVQGDVSPPPLPIVCWDTPPQSDQND